ncbi:MAG: energy-coupling factor transporter transmembrane protein EcfT [Anaerolineae bacterium]|nr:energy-coupling factor transporter transmembrane protein EcfT [Anaerolineae bacterium]
MSELLFVRGEGLLYRLDARVKLFAALAFSLYMAFEQDPAPLLAALGFLLLLGALSRPTWRRQLALWRALVPLLATVFLVGCLRWRPEAPLVAVGPIGTTLDALWQAVGMAVRFAGISLAISLAMWTTDPADAIAGLTRLGIPFVLGFPMIMVLQYAVTFGQRFRRILQAQQSRGLTFSRRNPIQVARAYIPVLVPLLIAALRSADTLTLALLSRGFGAPGKRSSRRVPHMQPHDWACALLCAAVVATLALV